MTIEHSLDSEKSQDYITVVSNIDTGIVEHLADERRQSSLDSFFEKFGTE